MSHDPIDRAAARLSPSAAQEHLADPEAWARSVLGDDVDVIEVARARVMLRLRAQTETAVAVDVAEADLPHPHRPPPTRPCRRCDLELPFIWTGRGWREPLHCDGSACKSIGVAVSRRVLPLILDFVRDQAIAFELADPAWSMLHKLLGGTMHRQALALELIAQGEVDDPQALAIAVLDQADDPEALARLLGPPAPAPALVDRSAEQVSGAEVRKLRQQADALFGDARQLVAAGKGDTPRYRELITQANEFRAAAERIAHLTDDPGPMPADSEL